MGGQGSGLGCRDGAEGREGAKARLPSTCCNPTDQGDRKTTLLACLLKLEWEVGRREGSDLVIKPEKPSVKSPLLTEFPRTQEQALRVLSQMCACQE